VKRRDGDSIDSHLKVVKESLWKHVAWSNSCTSGNVRAIMIHDSADAVKSRRRWKEKQMHFQAGVHAAARL
jgi:hypothetical protein